MVEVKTLVLTGYGINCDFETQNAFALAGAKAERVHFNELLQKNNLEKYQILAIPGGFSFADDIASGKVFAAKLKRKMRDQLVKFVDEGNLVIGICNGFQILVKAGILPNPKSFEQTATVTFNDSGHFEDRWVWLKQEKNSNCIWTKGVNEIYLPVRHGEGKFYAQKETMNSLRRKRQIVFRYMNPLKKSSKAEYPWNPNGSLEDIAGISDESGRVFALMPHPEAFSFITNHPRWERGEAKKAEGLKIFQNAVEYARKKLV
jgi:phosphoribosylformylglycinamidine synthase